MALSTREFVTKALTCARGALQTMVRGSAAEPNDLIAGALACDELARRTDYPTVTGVIAAQLRALAIEPDVFSGQELSTYAQELDQLLAKFERLVAVALPHGLAQH
jgi:hypothetical protein